MMNFVAGAEIPDRYVPFLMEELALEGTDVKAAFTGQDIPDAAKKNFHVLIVGAGMSGHSRRDPPETGATSPSPSSTRTRMSAAPGM